MTVNQGRRTALELHDLNVRWQTYKRGSIDNGFW